MVRIIITTFPDMETAKRITRDLVERKMAACANLLPGVTSIYRWKGAVHDETEVLGIIKTKSDRLDELLEDLNRFHPYEVPEGLILSPAIGFTSYHSWIEEMTDPDS